MKNKWYRSKLVKTILVIAEHVFTVLICASILSAITYPTFAEEFVRGQGSKDYEESGVFEDTFRNYSMNVLEGMRIHDNWEINGEYDPKKIVDIQDYWDKNIVTGENKSGLAYYLGDILAWETDYEEYMPIIVCEREDGSYHYYWFSEFQQLITEGKLVLNGYINEQEGLLEYMSQMGDTGENFLRVKDNKGNVVYINCWEYGGDYIQETVTPIGAESLVDLVNNNEDWNGRLQDACSMITQTVQEIQDEEYLYWEVADKIKEGDTNYLYVYIDKRNGKVYSNNDGFKKVKNAEEYIEYIKSLGKYVVVEPQLMDFESNISQAEAVKWRDVVNNYAPTWQSENGDFLFAAGIDTEWTTQDDFYKEALVYEEYGSTVRTLFVFGIGSVVLWIAGLIWLTMIAGKNSEDETITLSGFDHWKTEIAASIIMIVTISLAVSGFVFFADCVSTLSSQYLHTRNHYDEVWFIAASTGLILLAFSVFLIGYLSLVRRIKAKTLWKDSVLRMVVVFVVHLFDHIQGIWRTLLVFCGFVGVNFFLGALAAWTYDGGFCLFLLFVVDILGVVYFAVYAIGKEKIRVGIKKIAEGDVDYKISTDKMLPEHKKMAETVNAIGEGLDAAVEKSMKSERLKTDLITNVSHDIKTPLTSIINYVDLLKKENFTDPKVQRYIEILEQKAQRLKVLTEDVVEASKVSSGNVTLEYMKLNFVEMIQQTSGEFEEKFKSRGLQEILRLPDEDIMIRVDGRRTWRILENVYNNAAKYALEGSRVYADLTKVDGKAVFTLKNISDQPLNISAEELTERFIRGDISRSTEGSGLGLSIARSLTEMQGGTFELYLDGDLFKVTVAFAIV